MVVVKHGVNEVVMSICQAARTEVLVVRWDDATQMVIA